MKRILTFLGLLIVGCTVFPPKAQALNYFNHSVQRGGQTVVTSFAGSTVKAQRSWVGATVYVYDLDTVVLADDVYTDSGGLTPKANPMTASSFGEVAFYGGAGCYTFTFVLSGATTWSDSVCAATYTNFTMSNLSQMPSATALSLLGRSANSVGVYADITCSANGMYYQRNSDTILCQALQSADLPSDGYASTYVNVSGDTMTGGLTVSTTGAANLTATNTTAGGGGLVIIQTADTAVIANDVLGYLQFWTADSDSAFPDAISIRAVATAAHDVGGAPTELEFNINNSTPFTMSSSNLDLGLTTVLGLASNSGPTVDAAGETGFDNNLWAASRGTITFFDGTAATAVVATLASDAPADLQIPRWNTGGTVTWEPDSVADGDKGDVTITAGVWAIDSGAVNFSELAGAAVDAQVPDTITISLAAAATALAADPADCAANQFATTIAASGALTCAGIVDADVPDTITVSLAAAATALAADPAACAANQFANDTTAAGAVVCVALADADVPNTITVDLATVATTANAGDTATAFFAAGTIEAARLPAASDTASGISELATIAETNTGTDATRAVTPDGLAGSNTGKRVIQIKLWDETTAITVGDGRFIFRVPAEMAGMVITSVRAYVTTVSSSGTPTFQIRSITDSVDVLSTLLTIDVSEKSSTTAVTAAVINTANDDLADDEELAIDIDVAGTGAKGAGITIVAMTP